MANWTAEELEVVGDAEELRIRSSRADDTLRKPVIIWVVRVGDALYVRAVGGPESPWYRGTQTRHEGHISAGGVERDVTFASVDPSARPPSTAPTAPNTPINRSNTSTPASPPKPRPQRWS